MRALTQWIPVVRPLVNDDDGFPGDEPDVERQQRRRVGPHWVHVPDQPMRISQPVRPDLLTRAVERCEWIVVRNPVAPVLADSARLRVLAQVGDDTEDLADQGVEPLRVEAAAVALFARARVASAEVHDAPIGIALAGGGIERHLAERVLW